MSLYENCIRIRGFLGKDAMTRSIANGKIVVGLSVATKSSHKEKETGEWVSQTFWHRVTAFGKPALDASNLQLIRGDYVEIEGELRSSEYDAEVGEGTKKTTVKRRDWEIRASVVKKLALPTLGENLDAEPSRDANELSD